MREVDKVWHTGSHNLLLFITLFITYYYIYKLFSTCNDKVIGNEIYFKQLFQVLSDSGSVSYPVKVTQKSIKIKKLITGWIIDDIEKYLKQKTISRNIRVFYQYYKQI